ncbi:MAG: hypothetical protein ABJB34_13540, partial [Acidobacteriota bacterium]
AEAAEQQKQNEMMQRQLQEAAEQRLQADKAAEEDRWLREKEEAAKAASAEVSGLKVRDENPLDIPVAADVVAYRESSAVDEVELAAVLREFDEADAADAGGRDASINHENSPENLIVFDSPLDSATKADSTLSQSQENEEDIFTVPEKTGFSMGMPAIAGAAATLVVFIAVGAWFAMSGSSGTVKPEPAPAVQVTQPAPVSETPPTDTIASSQSETNSTVAGPPNERALVSSKPSPTPKPKKEIAKAASDKKKVTVDDLINDN